MGRCVFDGVVTLRLFSDDSREPLDCLLWLDSMSSTLEAKGSRNKVSDVNSRVGKFELMKKRFPQKKHLLLLCSNRPSDPAALNALNGKDDVALIDDSEFNNEFRRLDLVAPSFSQMIRLSKLIPDSVEKQVQQG